MEQNRKAAHAALLFVVAVVGWGLVAYAASAPGPLPTVLSAAVFLAVAIGARVLAFPIAVGSEGTEMSLDSAIFIAATACLGVRATAVGVALVMLCDRSVRAALHERRASPGRRPRSWALGDALYIGGLSGGLLVVWSKILDVGRGRDIDLSAVWLVPTFGGAFLISHYLMQSLERKLGGRSFRALVGRSMRSVMAEASLLPLAAAIVIMWKPGDPVAFALLGATYLLVNLGFNRLAQMATTLSRRVSELETLNRTAHVLGASLERRQIVSALLKETARALPSAFRVEALLIEEGRVLRHAHDRGLGERQEFAAIEARELRSQREAAVDDDVSDEARPDVRTRMQVPLLTHGECVGVLIAESRETEAFGGEELRLLDAIGGQAAASVENARLYGLANVDGLTGLYCRRYLDVRLAEEIERGRRFNTSFALVLLDVDDFKHLNDTFGHVAGDRALREISAIAANQLRGVDLAARYGGEELAFLLPRTSVADAHAVAERIREALALHSFADGGRSIRITASLGVAGWTEGGGGDVQHLIRRADAALYSAKRAGKNRVEVDLQHFELTPSLAPVRRRARS